MIDRFFHLRTTQFSFEEVSLLNKFACENYMHFNLFLYMLISSIDIYNHFK
jgi:hypothetical protein